MALRRRIEDHGGRSPVFNDRLPAQDQGSRSSAIRSRLEPSTFQGLVGYRWPHPEHLHVGSELPARFIKLRLGCGSKTGIGSVVNNVPMRSRRWPWIRAGSRGRVGLPDQPNRTIGISTRLKSKRGEIS